VAGSRCADALRHRRDLDQPLGDIERAPPYRRNHRRAILENLAISGWWPPRSNRDVSHAPPRRAIVAPEGLLVLLLVALVVSLATAAAVREPARPGPARRQDGLLSLVWLNVGLVMAVRGVTLALAVAVLWVPAFLLGRWLYST